MDYDDDNNFGLWRNYMRIRVFLDVRVPLKRKRKVRIVNGEWAMISFTYERLGTFCFLCGLLGHSDHFCSKLC